MLIDEQIVQDCVVLDAVRIGDREYALERARHVVLGASVYLPARREKGRNAANVTQIWPLLVVDPNVLDPSSLMF